jgi:uncharacterized protein YcnI
MWHRCLARVTTLGQCAPRAALPALLAFLATASVAQAHVQVTPHHSVQGTDEQYTVTVPTERPVPTVAVRVLIPAGVVIYSYAAAPGWQRELQEDSSGHVTAITWSHGLILPEEYVQFGFAARNPPGGTLVWKAYQTYQDGLVVAWIGPQSSRQPASVTTLGGAGVQGDGAQATTSSSGSSDSTTAGLGVALSALALALSVLNTGLLVLVLRRRLL